MKVVPDIVAIVSSKGQVVIPKSIRERLGLHSGSELHIQVKGSNVLELKLIKRDISELFGMGAAYVVDQPVMSMDDIDEAIGKAVTEND